jgi:hypothetical protein
MFHHDTCYDSPLMIHYKTLFTPCISYKRHCAAISGKAVKTKLIGYHFRAHPKFDPHHFV